MGQYKAEHDLMTLSSAGEGLSRRTRRAHNQFSEFIKGSSTSRLQGVHAPPLESPSTAKVSSKKREKQKAITVELESPNAPVVVNAITPPASRKRRKTVTSSTPETPSETIPPAQPTFVPSKTIPAQSHDRSARSSRRRAEPPPPVLPATIVLPPKTRRVVLRVTTPEGALEQLLKRSSEPLPPSFKSLDDKTGASISDLQARVTAASALAEKKAMFSRNGWYLPLDRYGERERGPPKEPERHVGTWDVILKAIEVAYPSERLYLTVTRQICGALRVREELNLCGKVTQGRPVRGAAKTKGLKKQIDDPETARRKRLAKATVELVIDQWKRVVMAGVAHCF